MKKIVLFLLLLISCGLLFAQTDYMFVLEKPAVGEDISISVFQTLAAALVTDSDTLSVVTYADKATYLFGPLAGSIPELIRIAGDKLRSDPLMGTITTAGISSGINLANEQAKAWERKGATSKLIIITSSLSTGKAANITTPDVFESIFYISLDAPLEQVFMKFAVSSSNGTKLYWAIDTKKFAHNIDPDFVSLADGIFSVVHANNKKFKNVSPDTDFVGFSAGNLLQQVRKAVILVKNTSNDPVLLIKPGKKAGNVSIISQSTFSVLQAETMNRGAYSVENGEIVLALMDTEISIVVFAAVGVILLVVLIIILVNIIKIIKIITGRGKAVFEIVVLRNAIDVCQRKPQVCIKKKNDDPMLFEHGAKFKNMFNTMGPNFPNNELSNVVDDEYPQILFNKKMWFVKFNSKYIRKAPAADKKKKIDIDSISLDGSGSDSQTGAEGVKEEIITLESDTVLVKWDHKGQFEVKNIFKKNSAYNLFLKKLVNKT